MNFNKLNHNIFTMSNVFVRSDNMGVIENLIHSHVEEKAGLVNEIAHLKKVLSDNRVNYTQYENTTQGYYPKQTLVGQSYDTLLMEDRLKAATRTIACLQEEVKKLTPDYGYCKSCGRKIQASYGCICSDLN
jgi:regulator of replication initiation timing